MHLPEGEQHEHIGTELATLDGVTYVSLPSDTVLPADQPEEIASSIVNPVTLDATLREQIKTASPHAQLINQRVVDKIREAYSIEDEIKCLRLAPSEETTAWNAHVEACREWGAEQKSEIGL